MKARRGGIVFACAAAALLVLAPQASAKPGYVVKHKSLHLHFAVPASNGYSLSIDTAAHRRLTVSVSKGGFFATYNARGRVWRNGIEADLGRFGRISLRFDGKSRFTKSLIPGLPLPDFLRPDCSGRRPVRERGIFRGNVRFEGERGFTRAVASRVKGTVVRTYKRVCKGGLGALASKAGDRAEAVFVDAQAQRLGVLRYLSMGEISIPGKGGSTEALTIALAGQRERIDRVVVNKLLFIFEALDSIAISPRRERPITAKVRIRTPFEGTASYLEEGTAPPTWSGSLGVRLPGSGLVSLTGPEFEISLCRAASDLELDQCLEEALSIQQLRGAAPTPSLWRWPSSPR